MTKVKHEELLFKILVIVFMLVFSVLFVLSSDELQINDDLAVESDTITYLFEILDYDNGGWFGDPFMVVSNDHIDSVFIMHEDKVLSQEDFDWFEYDEDIAITFKRIIEPQDIYDEYVINNNLYIVYKLVDSYIYVENYIMDYYEYEYIEPPSLTDQETTIETIYEVDYDLVFTDFAEYGEDNGVMGEYNLLTDTIRIKEGLPDFLFSPVYAHELEHSRGTLNERETNYLAFITLWESDIPYLKYQVYLQVQYLVDWYYSWDYDCSKDMFEYAILNQEVDNES